MSSSYFGSYKLSLILFLTMLFLTGYLSLYSYDRTKDESYQNFVEHSESLVEEILEREQSYLTILRGTKGFFGASEVVTQDEWNSYVAEYDIENRFKGIQGLVFAPVVPKENLTSHENTYRQLLSRKDYSVLSEGSKDYYIPMVYIEPFTGTNPDAVGLDMAQKGQREDAIITAIKSEEVSNSGKLYLRQKSAVDEDPGFILYAPLYRNENGTNTLSNTEAIILLGFKMEKFLDGIFPFNDKLTRIAIYDGQIDANSLLYINHQGNPGEMVYERSIQIANKNWILKFEGDYGYGLNALERYSPYLIAVIGLLISGFVGLLLYFANTREQRAKKMANRMLQSFTKEKKVAEEERNKIKTIIDSLSDGLIVTDAHGIVIRINPIVTQILGFTEKELLGKDYKKIFPVYDSFGKILDSELFPIQYVLQNGKKFTHIEKTFYYKNTSGLLVPVSISASPIKLEGEIIGVAQVFRDITELERIDRAKTEFVSLASHQLRTPLTAIGWYTEMLLDDRKSIPEKYQTFLDEIQEGSRRMVELVDALLNVSRIELGSFAVDPVDVSVNELMKEIQEEVSALLKEKKINIVTNCNPDKIIYRADKSLLKIIVSNLVVNAIKYSDHGSVVEVSFDYEKEFILQVKDKGRGIPEQDQKHIFEKMFRATNALTTDTTGTGLGLYIIKAIVEQANGSISFVSEENKGTTFTVVLPKGGMLEKEGSKPLI